MNVLQALLYRWRLLSLLVCVQFLFLPIKRSFGSEMFYPLACFSSGMTGNELYVTWAGPYLA